MGSIPISATKDPLLTFDIATPRINVLCPDKPPNVAGYASVESGPPSIPLLDQRLVQKYPCAPRFSCCKVRQLITVLTLEEHRLTRPDVIGRVSHGAFPDFGNSA
jgi:hypothetical protein